LTQWGVEVAEQLQVPLYLEATDKSVGLYKKFGFNLLDSGVHLKAEVMESDNDVEAPVMVRMPSSAAGISLESWTQQQRADLN
jgi:hypothetical protein